MSTPVAPLSSPESTDQDAQRVAAARGELTRLATALVRDPLDPTVHDALRSYLSQDAPVAVASLQALRTRAEHHPEALRSSIERITTALLKKVR